MKIKLKKLIVLLLISMLIISMSTVVRADDTQTQTQSSNGNFDVSSFDSGAQATKVDDLVNDASETVVAVMRIASVAISIVILLVIAIVPVVETISVILQVLYFRKTGKRLFRMAPLHHHFELSGWRENKVVAVFSGITLIAAIVAIAII